MRALALLAAVAAPAVAEPPAKPPADPPKTIELFGATIEGMPRDKLVEAGVAVGIDGKPVAGIVVTPPAHPDRRPWPEGMVMTPPDPHDPMALELGTNQQRAGTKVEPWLPRDLSRAFKRGADRVWDLVLPKL